MKINYLKRICKAILAGRFNYENYLNGGYWYGVEIMTCPLFVSYGQIGFTASISGKTQYEIEYDWEMGKLAIDDVEWKQSLNLLYLEEKGFNVNNTSSGDTELETYTDTGEDMIISLEEVTKESLQQYIEGFDINEEVLLWWPDGKPGRGVPFDNIKEHYEDYEAFLKWLTKVADKMPF